MLLQLSVSDQQWTPRTHAAASCRSAAVVLLPAHVWSQARAPHHSAHCPQAPSLAFMCGGLLSIGLASRLRRRALLWLGLCVQLAMRVAQVALYGVHLYTAAEYAINFANGIIVQVGRQWWFCSIGLNSVHAPTTPAGSALLWAGCPDPPPPPHLSSPPIHLLTSSGHPHVGTQVFPLLVT